MTGLAERHALSAEVLRYVDLEEAGIAKLLEVVREEYVLAIVSRGSSSTARDDVFGQKVVCESHCHGYALSCSEDALGEVVKLSRDVSAKFPSRRDRLDGRDDACRTALKSTGDPCCPLRGRSVRCCDHSPRKPNASAP